ncbi:MAG TPA: AIR synthase related protein [Actinomycetota bacterium]|nr:AIR synthase related protein [Actinomycetota bacterium]
MKDSTLDEVVAAFRSSAALKGKASIGLVSEVFGATDWISGPGDDTAVVTSGAQNILVAGEAIWPPFVEADPFGAGVAAVVANVNDVAAMGGRAIALVDQVVAREEVARRVLEGIRFAAGIYGLPVVGGHLTIWDGSPSVSASIVGTVQRPLSSSNAAPGQTLLAAFCLEGKIRSDFPFLSSIRERAGQLAADIGLLAGLAEAGLVQAAKDVSMAGTLGSLAMLLEPSGCGALVDLDRVPVPGGVSLAAWVSFFPTYGFLLTSLPENAGAVRERFRERGLACDAIGTVDDSGRLRARFSGEESELLDLNTQTVTGLNPPPPDGPAG